MPKVVPEYREQARVKIIEHALKVFSERGYYRTRMIDIANELGVSKAAMYQYFKSKEQLFIEAVSHHGEKRGGILQDFLDSGSLKSISSGEFFNEMLKLRRSSLSLAVDLFHETEHNKALRKILAEIAEDWVQGIAEMLDEMKTKGMLREGIDSSLLSRGILALRDGLYSHYMLGAEINEVRKTWVYMMSHLMDVVLTENLE